ncbi:hypothetical protein JD844_011378 [Phrynosoma platyrhinos]|uniref:NADH dehydrogenase [ubiquinone] 1 alpha subcomplex assembly factor 8 n=1 Tax=Phrynosoma platyrhinos TaxID=52577 RepID=A0ABQ7TI94_PHRPL|nr:hypothetical protein JD844_011378 [Phrynosoma platyrhinos]
MASRGGAWGRVRERLLRRFPESLAGCGEQASAYGKCIASHAAGQVDLRKDVCAKEFEMLMDCFTKAVSHRFLFYFVELSFFTWCSCYTINCHRMHQL